MSERVHSAQVAFDDEKRQTIETYPGDAELQKVSHHWRELAFRRRYMYNFAWLGRPIIQIPVDIVAVQELIFTVRPDVIIETGVAHGGSLVLSASILAMLDYGDAVEQGVMLDPAKPKRKVIGVDIDIRAHNRAALDAHPMRSRIELIQGSSIDPAIVEQVRDLAAGNKTVLVFLDSNHTHDHVLAELEAYAPMASVGSYCVAFDTVVEDLPDDLYPDRPWSKGNNPKTAVHEYLKAHPEYVIDREIDNKLLISVAPDGYLKRIA